MNVFISFYVVLRSNYSSKYLVPFLGICMCVLASVAREYRAVIDKHEEVG